MSQKVKRLVIDTPQGHAGDLDRTSQYVFNYGTKERDREISLAMPIRPESYVRSTLHPILAMNKPEGWLQQRIVERMAKHVQIDDMRLMSIVGRNQIGRVTCTDPDAAVHTLKPDIALDALLKQDSNEVFNFLVDRYLECGVSGVQPKVLIPDAGASPPAGRATTINADLIVKTSGREFPNLTVNEFLCMEVARRANIRVPDFWLSADRGLFVMRRFDLSGAQHLGFEDMAVLMDKNVDPYGRYKYESSYENVVKAIHVFCRGEAVVESARRFFEYLTLSVMVRNGDAHLKNFGLLHEHPAAGASPALAPLYDVVTTSVYDDFDPRTQKAVSDRTLALKLRKSTAYPSRKSLMEFGAAECFSKCADDIIDRIGHAMGSVLADYQDLAERAFMQRLKQEWDSGRESMQPVKFHLPPDQ
jgi:serine/threonine-protein kinase HipA